MYKEQQSSFYKNEMGNKGVGVKVGKMENKTGKIKNTGDKNYTENKFCKIAQKCGGCRYQGMSYEEQLGIKQREIKKLLSPFGSVEKIIGMYHPYHYRNKVHAVFGRKKNGEIISGTYEANTHKIVPVEECLIEDEKCQEIIRTIRGLLASFKIKTYDEDTGYGLLRHVLVRRGFKTGEIMVVLVADSPILPSKNNFVKALLKAHPEVSTVILNVNDKRTSMVLGERNIVLYGKGFIRDRLCGMNFRLSPDSFYQVNSLQTEKLYNIAMEYAGLKGNEEPEKQKADIRRESKDEGPVKKPVVIDAYCGIGTIGLVASKYAEKVIGVELNGNAVKDAVINARENKRDNIKFYQGDAGEFMESMAERGEHADILFMDPPRAGSDEKFLSSAAKLSPETIVYISCNPETLAGDLKSLRKKGYEIKKIRPVDMFPWTEHTECVVKLERKE